MAYASKAGRARANSSNPRAQAACDRCGIWYQHIDLRFQFDWAGASMRNTQMLVCHHCYDEPQEQLRAIVIPADPVPIIQPRLEQQQLQSPPGIILDQNGEIITDPSGNPINPTPGSLPKVPPYPFAGYVLLRSLDGGRITQFAVRDDAYAIQERNDVQQQLLPGATPQFSLTPSPVPSPHQPYNDLNIPANRKGSHYAYPVVILKVPD